MKNELTDDEYYYLAKCSINEFNNWCVRKLSLGDAKSNIPTEEKKYE